MSLLVRDPDVEEELIRERQARGADLWDEVWDGAYVMSPLADVEHQCVVGDLVAILGIVIRLPGLGRVCPGLNVSDRDDDWTQNYRCPDVVVLLKNTQAINRHDYLLGGPDFVVEIVMPRDLSRKKIPFYAKVGIRELLVIDRKPWALELYRLEGDQLPLVGRLTLEQPEILASSVVPLTFRLVPGHPHPRIDVRGSDGAQDWLI